MEQQIQHQQSSLRGASATWQSRAKPNYYGLLHYVRNDSEGGNALIFILIAIALLGLLTVSLSKSSSDSNDTGSFEQNQIAASEILTYAKSIENAVQSLLARGCSENEISFENGVVAGYTNPNSPTDNSCHVFDVAGAGMTYIKPNENWLDKSFSASSSYGNIVFTGHPRIIGIETTRAELTLITPYLNLNTCEAINKITKITNPPPVDSYNSPNFFTGIYGSPISQIGEEATILEKETNFCAQFGIGGFYYSVTVLHAR